MARTFMLPLRGGPVEGFERLEAKAIRKGISFHGDFHSGWLSGGVPGTQLNIKGTYEITRGEIAITIEKKPLLYSWGQVEALLRGFVEG
jgi:hypothetical protein